VSADVVCCLHTILNTSDTDTALGNNWQNFSVTEFSQYSKQYTAIKFQISVKEKYIYIDCCTETSQKYSLFL